MLICVTKYLARAQLVNQLVTLTMTFGERTGLKQPYLEGWYYISHNHFYSSHLSDKRKFKMKINPNKLEPL